MQNEEPSFRLSYSRKGPRDARARRRKQTLSVVVVEYHVVRTTNGPLLPRTGCGINPAAIDVHSDRPSRWWELSAGMAPKQIACLGCTLAATARGQGITDALSRHRAASSRGLLRYALPFDAITLDDAVRIHETCRNFEDMLSWYAG